MKDIGVTDDYRGYKCDLMDKEEIIKLLKRKSGLPINRYIKEYPICISSIPIRLEIFNSNTGEFIASIQPTVGIKRMPSGDAMISEESMQEILVWINLRATEEADRIDFLLDTMYKLYLKDKNRNDRKNDGETADDARDLDLGTPEKSDKPNFADIIDDLAYHRKTKENNS